MLAQFLNCGEGESGADGAIGWKRRRRQESSLIDPDDDDPVPDVILYDQQCSAIQILNQEHTRQAKQVFCTAANYRRVYEMR